MNSQQDLQGAPRGAIKPMTFRASLLYFGIPMLAVAGNVHLVMPWFAARGMPVFWNYLLVYATAPMLVLIGASIVAFRLEGGQMNWSSFKKRFRLIEMDGRAWRWAFGLLVVMLATAASLSFSARWLASFSLLAPPDHFPVELDPTAPAPQGLPSEFMGVSLAGNWWVLVVLLVSLVIATLGEELWWRGYILPRQELVHGDRTWIVHGILWTCFHLFAPWNFLVILPGCLALSFVAQKLGNTWPAIVAHALTNGLLIVVVVLLGVSGVGG